MKKSDIKMTLIFAGIGILFAVIAIIVKSNAAKWIWGVLAVAVLGFTVYAAIDAIAKNKREPKDLADLLIKSFEIQSKKPGFKDDFAKGMEEIAKRRDILFEGQRYKDDDYGYSKNNPIMTSTVSRSDEYLSKLRTLDDYGFTWERTGSYCVANISGVENIMVDEYQLFLNSQKYGIIYICPYGHSSGYVPKGLKLEA